MNDNAALLIAFLGALLIFPVIWLVINRDQPTMPKTKPQAKTPTTPSIPTFGGSFKYDGKKYNFEDSGKTLRPPSLPQEEDPFIAPQPKALYEQPCLKYAGNMWKTTTLTYTPTPKPPVSEPYDLDQPGRMMHALNAASLGMLAWVAYKHKNADLMNDATADYHSAIILLKQTLRKLTKNPVLIDAMVTHDVERAYEELTGKHAY